MPMTDLLTWTFPHTGIWWVNVVLLVSQLATMAFLLRSILSMWRCQSELQKRIEEAKDLLRKIEEVRRYWK